MLPWKCHSGRIIELCDECNNLTKFQFCTERNVGNPGNEVENPWERKTT